MLISWNVTKRCNLSCKHCYRDAGGKAEADGELTLEEGKKLISEIAEAGFRLLILSGGEPLLRPDIYDLVCCATDCGVRPVLGTNGTMIDPQTARRLKESGLAGVGVSLDDTDASGHDRFRGEPGAHGGAIEGIKNALRADLKVQINMTVTRDNRSRLNEMAEFARKLGADAFHPFFLVPVGRGRDIEDKALSRRGYFEALEEVLQKQKSTELEIKPTCAPQFMPMAKDIGLDLRFTRGCLAGVSYCCILPDGQVHVCPYLPEIAGDVREKPFDDIWKNSKVFSRLRNYSLYEGRCGGCENVDICGGCRARAFFYSDGNYLAQDPWCLSSFAG